MAIYATHTHTRTRARGFAYYILIESCVRKVFLLNHCVRRVFLLIPYWINVRGMFFINSFDFSQNQKNANTVRSLSLRKCKIMSKSINQLCKAICVINWIFQTVWMIDFYPFVIDLWIFIYGLSKMSYWSSLKMRGI